jgi:hypothetical protein
MEISTNFPNVAIRTKQRTSFPSSTSNYLKKYVKFIHSNQIAFGNSIRDLFLDRTVHSVLALALTQSGKTGAMLATIHSFMTTPSLAINLHNVFIITGHSSNEWVQQTRERFPVSMHHNIIHRNSLKHFIHSLKSISNALIFIDETQIAALKGQTIELAFKEAGISEIDLYMRDIKMVLVTATPNSCVKRFIPARVGYKLAVMQPGSGYTSIFDLVDQHRVFQFKDLCGFDRKSGGINPAVLDNIRDIIPLLTPSPKYHIIRTHHSFLQDITIRNFISVFGDSVDYISNPTDFSFLSSPPLKHSFIFIKERLRCSTTIHKEFLGVLYERFSKRGSHSAIIQGLAGRITGYYDSSFSPVVFSNLYSIDLYKISWLSIFKNYSSDSISVWDF